MSRVLPPGVNAADFEQAVGEMKALLGREWVYDEEPRLHGYQDHFAILDPEKHAPSAAIAPAGVEDIQRVLAIARKYRIPLWTVSTGRNLAYGGAAPRRAGCIVLDLRRMNRIIEVNEKHAYAVVEPGVSYFALYNHLKKIGSRLWIDCAAPGWGGVVGNLMDRGVGYTPYGEHFMAQCGMQVVLADGTVVETGMGSQPGSNAGGVYKYGRGPWVDGMFTQANYGIVTRLGIHLMPEPPGYRPYLVTFPEEDDVHQVTEVIRPLKLNMLIPNAAVTVELNLEASAAVSRAQYYSGEGPLPESARRKIMEDLRVGKWNFYAALYGPEKMMDNDWKVIEESFRQVRGAQFYFEKDKGQEPAFNYRAKLMRGIPNMTEFGILNWVPNGAHVGFSPMAAVDGDTALEQYRFARDLANQYGFDYTGEYIVGWRDMHHVFVIFYSRDNADQKRRVHELMNVMIDRAAAQGYGEYRTHLDYMDRIAASYNWNNGALGRFNHRIKDVLDPDGILAPGKSGIWPANLRPSGPA
ncbi:MAG: FAD-binding oxidoreductase [Gammaproteobacteria bacterium]|nr:FAD-binding oxidoreductase [Gammaproteobacteria bacterium]